MFGDRDFLLTFQPISKMFTVAEVRFKRFILVALSMGIFAPRPRNGAQINLQPSTHYISGCFRFSRQALKLATHKFTQGGNGRCLNPERRSRRQAFPVGFKSRRRLHLHKVIIFENLGNYCS